jgi:2-polyprenyl-3-methyl-5-hydroxy-6-metoxy-1,4-benzoquinol methylase
VQHFIGLRRRQCRWPSIPHWLSKARKNDDVQLDAGPFMALSEIAEPARQRMAAERFIARKLNSTIQALPTAPDWKHDKLRIGYLSGDFKHHAVSILMAEVFELHDRERVQIYGLDYSEIHPTAMRQRVLNAFDYHIPLHSLTDAQAASRIRALEIDIIIDLTGLTAGSRFGILAYRAAPMQVSYLGYMGSSAIPGMDYILADAFLMPPELTAHFTEKPLYLKSYQANDRKRVIADAPTREACGLPKKAFVFCAFNNNYKFTPDMWARWMRILERTEGSVLWVLEDNAQARENLTLEAKKHRIDADRLIFASRVAPEDYLARYHCADLFLDTTPYGAGTTASDALWVGLPVLTCPDQSMVSRMAGSLLHAVGLPELVADTPQAYEELAVALATKPRKLSAIRKKLNAQRDSCALFNTPEFVKDLENVLIENYQAIPKNDVVTVDLGEIDAKTAKLVKSVSEKKIRLFSIFWSEATQVQAIISGFEPLNNMDNKRPDWYEYWPIRNFLLNETLNENTYYGFFSTKFSKKTQLSTKQTFDFIEQSIDKGADVVLFSPQPDQAAGFLNVFEQCDLYWPGYLGTCERFFTHMGLKVNLRSIVMDSRTIVFSNYFVARPVFWREWLTFCEALFDIAEKGNLPLAKELNQATNYPGGVQVKVFLIEAIASLLLTLYVKRFKTACANPWTMGWGMNRFRQYPHEMIISDALKMAMREQGYPEYTRAFNTVRNQLRRKPIQSTQKNMKSTPAYSSINTDLLALMPIDAKRVVDVGCMLGNLAQAYREINPNCHYIGIDIDADYANKAKIHCNQTIAADIENIDDVTWAQLETADCWVFGDSLEHLRNPWTVLERINKSMKANGGGTLVACVPNAQHWGIQMRLNSGEFRYEDSGLLDRTHLRWFTRITLMELFMSTGFQVLKGTVRFHNRPAPEKIMQAIGALAEASGANVKQAQEDAKVFQYVMQVKV